MRRSLVALLVAVAVIPLAVACGSDGSGTSVADDLVGTIAEVHVYDAWVPTTDSAAAGVSMRVHNAGPEDDRLLDATCACKGSVAIDGAVVVAPDEEIVLAAGGTPGLRLTGIAEPLRKGTFVTLSLTFEHAGEVTAEVEVRPDGA